LQNFSVYIISLKEDKERRDHMKSLMNRLGFFYDFFDAIESSEITSEDENGFFKNVDYHQYNVNAKSVMATFKSHLALIKKSAEENINMLILEDDADIERPEFKFDAINFKSFDVYNIGTDKIRSIDCHSYFISAEGSKKVIDHMYSTQITQAFDWEMIKIPTTVHLFENNPIFVQRKDLFASYNAPNGY
jgi:GR25 family glycosyltransferase involved in LPS biosynthesis